MPSAEAAQSVKKKYEGALKTQAGDEIFVGLIASKRIH
jgi:hypothetical protein